MDFSTLTDEHLFKHFKENHDSQVFSELVKRYETHITRECRQRLKDHSEAQDVAQEVLIRLLTKAHTYRDSMLFKPWLDIIIRNRCLDHINQDKCALHQEISKKIADTLEHEIDTEKMLLPTTEILRELLDKVTGEEKLILLLKYEQRWSIKAIQHALDLRESAVKQRLKRSRQKLQKLLNHYTDDEDKEIL